MATGSESPLHSTFIRAILLPPEMFTRPRQDVTQSECAHHLLLRYPSYALNHACALPSPSPFHYVMAKIVPAMQLAAHAKSSTSYGRSYCVKSSFFRLDALLLFRIIMGLHSARCELRYFCACCICKNS